MAEPTMADPTNAVEAAALLVETVDAGTAVVHAHGAVRRCGGAAVRRCGGAWPAISCICLSATETFGYYKINATANTTSTMTMT